ncbi:hypothetical protein GCM10010149_13790 [Nonomuraea roseoviolacea subsp. roseoviolacea]
MVSQVVAAGQVSASAGPAVIPPASAAATPAPIIPKRLKAMVDPPSTPDDYKAQCVITSCSSREVRKRGLRTPDDSFVMI